MESAFLKINWNDIKSAVISGVATAVIGYLASLTNILAVDFNTLLSLAITAALASLVKALGFDPETGRVFGVIRIK